MAEFCLNLGHVASEVFEEIEAQFKLELVIVGFQRNACEYSMYSRDLLMARKYSPLHAYLTPSCTFSSQFYMPADQPTAMPADQGMAADISSNLRYTVLSELWLELEMWVCTFCRRYYLRRERGQKKNSPLNKTQW